MQATIRAPAANASAMPPWDVMWNKLMESKLESLTPEEAQSRVDSGDWVIVDVRPKEEYEKSSILGAVSAPLFQRMDWSNPTPASFLRGAAYALNGVQAVEPNANFSEDIKTRCGGKKIIMVRPPGMHAAMWRINSRDAGTHSQACLDTCSHADMHKLPPVVQAASWKHLIFSSYCNLTGCRCIYLTAHASQSGAASPGNILHTNASAAAHPDEASRAQSRAADAGYLPHIRWAGPALLRWRRVLQVCDTGGTMRPTANFINGKTSRSLKAAFRAVNEQLAGDVAHLDGGMVAWCALSTHIVPLTDSPWRAHWPHWQLPSMTWFHKR